MTNRLVDPLVLARPLHSSGRRRTIERPPPRTAEAARNEPRAFGAARGARRGLRNGSRRRSRTTTMTTVAEVAPMSPSSSQSPSTSARRTYAAALRSATSGGVLGRGGQGHVRRESHALLVDQVELFVNGISQGESPFFTYVLARRPDEPYVDRRLRSRGRHRAPGHRADRRLQWRLPSSWGGTVTSSTEPAATTTTMATTTTRMTTTMRAATTTMRTTTTSPA